MVWIRPCVTFKLFTSLLKHNFEICLCVHVQTWPQNRVKSRQSTQPPPPPSLSPLATVIVIKTQLWVCGQRYSNYRPYWPPLLLSVIHCHRAIRAELLPRSREMSTPHRPCLMFSCEHPSLIQNSLVPRYQSNAKHLSPDSFRLTLNNLLATLRANNYPTTCLFYHNNGCWFHHRVLSSPPQHHKFVCWIMDYIQAW